jgi:hypothetical protein
LSPPPKSESNSLYQKANFPLQSDETVSTAPGRVPGHVNVHVVVSPVVRGVVARGVGSSAQVGVVVAVHRRRAPTRGSAALNLLLDVAQALATPRPSPGSCNMPWKLGILAADL